MTSLTPAQMGTIRAIEGIALAGVSVATYIILPGFSQGSINWIHIIVAFAIVFAFVFAFGMLEYGKQALQQQLVTNEAKGASTTADTQGITLLTQFEGVLTQLAQHVQNMSPLLTNLGGMISTLQTGVVPTTVIGPPQVLTTFPPVPQQAAVNVVPPVSTPAYDVSAVSSTTGVMPIVQAPASPAQTL